MTTNLDSRIQRIEQDLYGNPNDNSRILKKGIIPYSRKANIVIGNDIIISDVMPENVALGTIWFDTSAMED